jgi:hypothetical protein
MKMKFKLIKEFPGSPKLGKIVEIDSEQETGYYSDNISFWEKIIEKEHEILAFNSKNNDRFVFADNINYVNYLGLIRTFNFCIAEFNIESIKRCSDNLMFNIGDKTNNGTIREFKSISNQIRVFFEEKEKNYHVGLNSINHIKNSLSTTNGLYDYTSLEELVLKWAKDKGILDQGTPYKQAQKTLEECGELLHSIGKKDLDGIKDDLGDIFVTLIIQAEMQGFKLKDCLESAYNVISKRTGVMRNGTFVKEQ